MNDEQQCPHYKHCKRIVHYKEILKVTARYMVHKYEWVNVSWTTLINFDFNYFLCQKDILYVDDAYPSATKGFPLMHLIYVCT